MTYTIQLVNLGPTLPGVHLTDTLPAEVNYLNNLWASAGSYSESGGVITWTGEVTAGIPVTITYGVTVSPEINSLQAIYNFVQFDDGSRPVWSRQAMALVNGIPTFLPLVVKE